MLCVKPLMTKKCGRLLYTLSPPIGVFIVHLFCHKNYSNAENCVVVWIVEWTKKWMGDPGLLLSHLSNLLHSSYVCPIVIHPLRPSSIYVIPTTYNQSILISFTPFPITYHALHLLLLFSVLCFSSGRFIHFIGRISNVSSKTSQVKMQCCDLIEARDREDARVLL